MPILLAFTSALVYGVADYCGGRASRVQPSVIVTVVGQVVSLMLVLGITLAVGTAVPGASTFVWGVVGGVAGAVGLATLYYAFSHGSMTVVAPISAVVGSMLPFGVGLLDGERPRVIAYLGITTAVVAVALVSGAVGERDRPTPPAIVGLAVLAGFGFGVLFVALDRTDPDSGLWPLVAARGASVPLLLLICLLVGARVGENRSVLGLAVIAGFLDMVANLAYLVAVRGGMLSVVAVVSSLYPVSTVALAFVLDRERVNRWQGLGMGLAGVALVMVTLGTT